MTPPPPPLPPSTPQYLFIIMTDRGSTIIFCRILAPPQCPPHSPDATILIYLNDREGVPLSFVGFWPPPPNAPPPQTPQYLTILMTERGRHYVCRSLAPPMPLPPSHDATILNYLNDRERGSHYFLYDFGALNAPPPP